MRPCSTLGLFAAVLCAPVVAFAQQSSQCPPGAWFCEETPVERAPAAAAERPKAPPPDADDAPGEARAAEPRRPLAVPYPQRRRPLATPPAVVYQPIPSVPPAHVVIVAPGYGLVRPVPPPPPPPPRPRQISRSEWGVNMRIEGIALGRVSNSGYDSGMGGLGLSLRYRPVPHFALDLGTDLVGGTDYNGHQRIETPVSLSGILYVNPRSRTQFYLTGGTSWSHARVRDDAYDTMMYRGTLADSIGYQADYNYVGGHGGLGLEFRLSKHLALNLDMIGFMRSRVDRHASTSPEFVDPVTGRSTNTSGGGLFRGGLTIWW